MIGGQHKYPIAWIQKLNDQMSLPSVVNKYA